MAKVWEETWRVQDDGYVATDAAPVAFSWVANFCEFPGHPGFQPIERQRAQLAAAAPEMARLLLSLEEHQTYEETTCATCGGYSTCTNSKPDVWYIEHEPDCKWVAVLRKAGVIADKVRSP